MSSYAEAFTGLPFVAGDVRGIRSWDVDQLGRLISPSYKTVWTPGENVAVCKKSEGIPAHNIFLSDSSLRMMLGLNSGPSPARADEAVKERKKPHTQEKCACGFYAYSNGYNDYASSERITGVIQGYGETQLGTRGFKCGKAAVVALHIPAKKSKLSKHDVTTTAGHFERVKANYPDVQVFEKYADMVDAFPVYEHTPTPDTDPDFWTRGI